MNSIEKINNEPNKITKNQHFIPQFYLKSFSNSEGLLTQYDMRNHKCDIRSPKSICNQNYLYDVRWQVPNEKIGKFVFVNHLENEFMVREGEYSTLCRKIVSLCLNPNNKGAIICYRREKELLADFVTNMFLRNPCMMKANVVKSAPKYIVDGMLSGNHEEIDKTIGEDNISSFVATIRQYDFLSDNVPDGLHQQIKDIICRMNLSFFVTETDTFITSNYPVISVFDEEPKRKFRAFYFPLSPKCAVILYDFEMNLNYKNRIKYITSETANSFNHLYLELEDDVVKYLFAKDKAQIKDTINFINIR